MQNLQKKTLLIFILTFIIVSAFTFVAFLTYGRPTTGIDDANITFVYAKNFAEGHGFVYNVGGERVEGFSSMLWVLITAVAFKLFSNPEIFILGFNVLVISASITYFINYVLRRFHNKSSSHLVISIFFAWLLAVPSFIVWNTITLMEFGLYTSILLGLLTILLKSVDDLETRFDRRLFGVLLFALALVRPESLLWIPSILFIYFVIKLINHNWGPAIRSMVTPMLISFFTVSGLILFRLAYFGYPFPNTYYAKVSSNLMSNFKDGYLYLKDLIHSNNLVFILVVLTIALFVLMLLLSIKSVLKNILYINEKVNRTEVSLFVVCAMIVIGLFIPIYNGGDHFAQFRFIQPIWPFLILPIFYVFDLILPKFNAHFQNIKYLAISVFAISFALFYISNNIVWDKYKEQRPSTIFSQFFVADREQKFGEYVNTFFEEAEVKPEVGVLAAGGFKLKYQGEVNDLLGLNNVEMAHAVGEKSGIKNHASFNREVFLKQQPDALALYKKDNASFDLNNELQVEVDFWNLVLRDLFNDSEFKNIYSEAIVANKELGEYMYGYYRNEFLSTLNQDTYTTFRK